MKKITIIRIILIILILLWMYIVFGFSSQNGEKSGGISFKISMLLTRNNEENAKILEPYIRKIAHFSEYAVGGCLIYCLLLTIEKIKENIKLILATVIGFLYAVTDEVHQLFIPGREGKTLDVYIDTLGVIFGILMILLIRKIIEKIYCRGQ
ncbi:MAG: VanZ family protein [Candidatus Scatovivens sp.]